MGTVETKDSEEVTGILGHGSVKHQSGESGTCQMSENLSDIRERRRRFLQLLRTIPQWRPCGRRSIGRLHYVACSQVHCMQLSFSLRLLACGHQIATVFQLDLASPGYVPNYGTTRLSDVQRLHTLERLVEILTGSESRPVSLSLNVSHFNSARSVSCMMDWRDVDRQQS